jgi:hypothetical protein
VAKKRQMRVKTGLRTASKVQENQLISAGKWLSEHPNDIIPKCEEGDRRCNFSKIASKISLVSENKDDAAFLKKMAKKGDQLVRAYAATILLSVEKHAAYLAVARGSEGDIAYAFSPKVRKETLIGLQYFKDPHLRLFSYAHFSRKKKLIFYSTKDSVYCTAMDGKMPTKFIEETISRLNLSKKDKTTYSCGHNLEERGYLQIDLMTADISLKVCEKCLNEENPIMSKIVSRTIAPKIESLFDARVLVRLECHSACKDCPKGDMHEFDYDALSKYIGGGTSDLEMYEQAIEDHLASMKESNKGALVIGEKCYGQDKDKFSEALAKTPLERDAVNMVLSQLKGSVVVPGNMTTNKFLAQHWDEHGSHIMSELAGSKKGAAPPELSDNVTPMMLVERGRSNRRADQIKDSLPRYKSLGKHSSFVDSIIRTYKSSGSESALRLTTPLGTEDTHQKSIGLAFRIALGETGADWQYTREEKDMAKHLAAYAKTLLEAEGDEYDTLLRQFIRNAGIQDEIVRTK